MSDIIQYVLLGALCIWWVFLPFPIHPRRHSMARTIFDQGRNTYKSDLELGKKYRDKTTGIEGHLTGVHFYEHACERATLRYVDTQKRVQEISFDGPELVKVEDESPVRTTRTGGPARAEGGRSTPTR